MKRIATALICAGLALAAGGAVAQDTMKKDGSAEDRIMKKDWTIQDCNDHMAMSKREGMKKDDATMKMERRCADMMKMDGNMKKDDPMSKNGSSAEDHLMKKDWTIQDCKDQMAMSKKAGTAMKMMDSQCTAMMKDGNMKKVD